MSASAQSTRSWTEFLNTCLNYDFCPWANRWVYWLKHPLVGISVAAVAAGLCGLFVAPQAWLLSLGLISVCVIGLIWPAISIWGTRLEVVFDQAWCTEQSPTLIRVRVTNSLPWPVWGLSVAGGFQGNEVIVSFTRAGGWRTTEFLWEFTPQQRGVYPKSPLLLETAFPFGVWKARRLVQVSGELLVKPRPVALDSIPDIGGGQALEEIFSDRKTGDFGDVTGTRPFRQGDSLRRVHWSLTARMNRLICCERQAAMQSTAQVFLDVVADHHRGSGAEASLEWAIRIFAGICQELSQQGVHVLAIVGRETIPIQSGKQGIERLLLKLARLPAQGLPRELAGRGMSSKPGEFVIGVLTDLSADSGNGLTVMLQAAGFEGQESDQKQSEVASVSLSSAEMLPGVQTLGRKLTIQRPQQLTTHLPVQWRKLCHAAS